ncbi:MAG: 5-formyltetrahydrofolate cyclo-ligase [Pseudomonadota bacterium]
MATLDHFAERKTAARKAAFARRKAAHAAGAKASLDASQRLYTALKPVRSGLVVAGYRPIRTEIDPSMAMRALALAGARLCVPVIDGPGLPLRFREWSPGCAEIEGAFGARIPAEGHWLVPDTLIVPLVAFDSACARLGYGGGFYDRTLEELRAASPATAAIGFAYAAQEMDAVPREPTDQTLDLIVTEAGFHAPERAAGRWLS